jgi:glycosyltransferase involved in cell wall biosynthesis
MKDFRVINKTTLLRVFDSGPNIEEKFRLINDNLRSKIRGLRVVNVSIAPDLCEFKTGIDGNEPFYWIPVWVNFQRRVRKLKLLYSLEAESYFLYRVLMYIMIPIRIATVAVQLFRFGVYFFSICLRECPSLVQLNTTYDESAVICVVISRLLGIRTVVEFRSGIDKYWSLGYARGLLEPLKRTLIQNVVAMFAQTVTSLSSDWIGKLSKPVTKVGNVRDISFDIERKGKVLIECCDRKQIDQVISNLTSQTIFQIGKIENRKNQFLTLRTLKILLEQGLDVSVLLVGEYSEDEVRYERKIKRYIISSNLEGRIFQIFIKNKNQMQYLLEKLRECNGVAVLPSFEEGIPRVLFEVSGYKIPGVWSDLPGIRDVFSGYLWERLCNLNNPEELARKASGLLTDPIKYSTYGIDGYAAIQRYTVQRYNLFYESIYGNLEFKGKQNCLPKIFWRLK